MSRILTRHSIGMFLESHSEEKFECVECWTDGAGAFHCPEQLFSHRLPIWSVLHCATPLIVAIDIDSF